MRTRRSLGDDLPATASAGEISAGATTAAQRRNDRRATAAGPHTLQQADPSSQSSSQLTSEQNGGTRSRGAPSETEMHGDDCLVKSNGAGAEAAARGEVTSLIKGTTSQLQSASRLSSSRRSACLLSEIGPANPSAHPLWQRRRPSSRLAARIRLESSLDCRRHRRRRDRPRRRRATPATSKAKPSGRQHRLVSAGYTPTAVTRPQGSTLTRRDLAPISQRTFVLRGATASSAVLVRGRHFAKLNFGFLTFIRRFVSQTRARAASGWALLDDLTTQHQAGHVPARTACSLPTGCMVHRIRPMSVAARRPLNSPTRRRSSALRRTEMEAAAT
jgi:hypothetical protein